MSTDETTPKAVVGSSEVSDDEEKGEVVDSADTKKVETEDDSKLKSLLSPAGIAVATGEAKLMLPKAPKSEAGRKQGEIAAARSQTGNGTSTESESLFDYLSVTPMPLPLGLSRSTHRAAMPGAHAVSGHFSARMAAGTLTDAVSGGADMSDAPTADPTTGTSVNEEATILDATLVTENHTDNPNNENQAPPQEETFELFEAQAIPTAEEKRRKIRRGWLLLLAGAAIIGSALAAILILVPNNDSNSNNKPKLRPSLNGTYPPFTNDLVGSTLKAIRNDPNSAAHKANLWMLNDPNLDDYPPSRQRQRFNLVWWYYVTNGQDWIQNDYWLRYNVSECEWYNNRDTEWIPDDLEICDSEHKLQVLSLPHNNLNGTLPPSYNRLEHVIVFDIGYNNIAGFAPTDTGNLPIEVLIASHNQFSGVFASDGSLSELRTTVVKLDGNLFSSFFSGLLFPYWGTLEIWNVTDNLFHGFIAPSIGHCRNMTYLGAGSTELGGVLPSELGLLTNLQAIDLSHSHKFQGTLPSELGNLQKLTHLDVTGTSLTGTIPEPLCNRLRDPDDMLTIAASCDIIDCCALAQ